jgi:hypothetical protein
MMDRIKNHESADERVKAHRDVLKRSLDKIASQIESALHDAGLTIPVYLVVPNSGTAIIQFATLLDPPEADSAKTSEIVCQCVSDKLGGVGLGLRALQCAVANPKLHAVDVEVTDSLSS